MVRESNRAQPASRREATAAQRLTVSSVFGLNAPVNHLQKRMKQPIGQAQQGFADQKQSRGAGRQNAQGTAWDRDEMRLPPDSQVVSARHGWQERVTNEVLNCAYGYQEES